MTLTISFGWWLLPLAVTIVAFFWAVTQTNSPPQGLGDTGGFLSLLFAIIVSLISWLIWAVLT